MLMLVRYGASRNSAANIDYFSLLDVLMYYIYCTIKYCTYGLFLLGFLKNFQQPLISCSLSCRSGCDRFLITLLYTDFT